MLERFREDFHASLRDIIDRVTRRRGDPLFGAGVDDEPRSATGNHFGYEYLGSVDDTPEVDIDHTSPVGFRPKYIAARLHACIVHENMDRAEELQHDSFEPADVVELADV